MLRNKKLWLPLVIGLMLFAFVLFRFNDILNLVMKFLTIVSPFILGVFFALMINLPMRRLDFWLKKLMPKPKLFPVRRAISLTLSLLVVLAIVTLLMVVIIPEIIVAVDRLIRVIPGLMKDLELWLDQQNTNLRALFGLTETNEGEVRSLFQRASGILMGGLSYSSTVVISAASYLFNVIVGLVFAIYLLFSKEKVKGQLYRLITAALPEKTAVHVRELVTRLLRAYSNFLSGQLLQSFISSLATVLVLWVFGFPYAVLIGLITFVAAFIPVFGPFISGFLGLLLVLTANPGLALWFLLAFFIVQQVAGSVIYPRIMSDAIDIPSIWVLVAVTVGGGIMGIPGMLLFIPLTAVAFHYLAEYVKRKEEQELIKEQPIDTV